MQDASSQRALPLGFLAAFFGIWVIVLLVGSDIRPARSDVYAQLAFGDVERLICWVILPIAWMVVIERRPTHLALHPVGRRSARWAIIAATLLAVALLLGMKLTRGRWDAIPEGYSAVRYGVTAISVGLLALGEEFVFRGVVLSGLTQRGWRFWLANLVVAIAFALSHWPGWLMFGGIPTATLVTATMRVLLFGWLMGWLVWLEGGLIAAILVHWVNDILAGTLF